MHRVRCHIPSQLAIPALWCEMVSCQCNEHIRADISYLYTLARCMTTNLVQLATEPGLDKKLPD